MKNIELKKNLWKSIKPEILKEIGDKYDISVEDLEKDSKYFHPVIKISDFEYLRAQCDIESKGYYAVYLYPTKQMDIYDKIEIVLNTNSFKDAINIVKKKRIGFSIKDTFQEIEVLKQNIKYVNELIKAKRELLNSIVVRA